ncbi:MAG: bifunctional phosphopantothenoylcysteine decarboxylase/phosphopantothenate--cysteine ligase CoaBC [Actinomycetaceae bacterium]|nr:bifunctional phosphopantothenoylcysteine decarboxylase/phosphopantothenate--cysteine ligase CoaBC [Actinomycetaceae bacterium]
MDSPRNIILGVGAGIAAYKAVSLVRLWRARGHNVYVIPTPTALKFVGAPTWEAVSSAPVHTDPFEDSAHVEHVEQARTADLIVIAPATADLIAQLSTGMASNLLTATVISSDCPVVVCPAMHTNMYRHRATQRNLDLLRCYGYHIIEPASGALTSGDTGQGRLVEPVDIVAKVDDLLCDSFTYPPGTEQTLTGKNIVISAGGTREAIDPVRFIGNSSSGKQGVALAAQAARRGAHVHLVAAHVADSVLEYLPKDVSVTTVVSAQQMSTAMKALSKEANIIVMSAAVADYRPQRTATQKIKKTEDATTVTLTLEQTEDILVSLCAERKKGQVIIGFAAETGTDEEVVNYARQKIARKNADYLIVNNVSGGKVFHEDTNSVTIIDRSGAIIGQCTGTKDNVSAGIWDFLTPMFQ